MEMILNSTNNYVFFSKWIAHSLAIEVDRKSPDLNRGGEDETPQTIAHGLQHSTSVFLQGEGRAGVRTASFSLPHRSTPQIQEISIKLIPVFPFLKTGLKHSCLLPPNILLSVPLY